MIEIIAEGLQLEVGGDLQILITRQIADIREPEKRTSDWSKSFTLPGTKVNNKFFNAFFEVGKSTIGGNIQQISDFKVNKKAQCTIIANGMEQLRGFLRLTEVTVKGTNDIEYVCTVHGETADLFTNIKDLKLSDLDFSEYNHVLNRTNVINSWDTEIIVDGTGVTFEKGRGYVYSQMFPKRETKGYNSNEWSVADHTPCLYAKTVVDKIFENQGYSYTGDSFFNSVRFKNLIIPYTNYGFNVNDADVEDRMFRAQVTGATTLDTTGQNVLGDTLPASNDSTGGNFDNGNNYNPSTYKYTAPVSARYEFYLYLDASFNITIADDSAAWANFAVVVDGVYTSQIQILSKVLSNQVVFNDTGVGAANVIDGKQVEIKFTGCYVEDPSTGGLIFQPSLSVNNGTYWYNLSTSTNFFYNNIVPFESFFVGDFTQTELLTNFIKMFNLYIETTLDSKTLRIVPRDDFYAGTVDYSQKLDYSQPYEIVPYGDLQGNPYKFTYKEGKDEENSIYKTQTNQVYGERTYRIDNDFVKQEKKIEITFVPTMMTEDFGTRRFYSMCTTPDGQIGELRVLYFYGAVTVPFYYLFNTGGKTPGDIINKYPMTLHIDDTADMNFDLNFGMPVYVDTKLGIEYTNQNLVNLYYYKTLTEITDRDSKIFKGFFRITPKDWQTMKMSNLYFFEGQYWRLQTVTDYNPLLDDVYECEFLLAKYYPPFSRTKKQLGFGDVVDTGGGAELIPFGNKTNSTGSSTRGVYVGNNTGRGGENVVVGNLNAIGGSHNVVTSSERVVIPDNYENVTAIRCDNYNVPYTERLYIENYPCLGSWMSGGKVTSITNADSPYLATSEDWLILCDTNGGSITVTLPTPTAANSGKMYTIKKITMSHSVTINAGDGSIQIDDNTSHSFNQKNGFDQVVSDGTKYWVISEGH
jgi:hypothetical protein